MFFFKKKTSKDLKPKAAVQERILTAEGWRRRAFKKPKAAKKAKAF